MGTVSYPEIVGDLPVGKVNMKREIPPNEAQKLEDITLKAARCRGTGHLPNGVS